MNIRRHTFSYTGLNICALTSSSILDRGFGILKCLTDIAKQLLKIAHNGTLQIAVVVNTSRALNSLKKYMKV